MYAACAMRGLEDLSSCLEDLMMLPACLFASLLACQLLTPVCSSSQEDWLVMVMVGWEGWVVNANVPTLLLATVSFKAPMDDEVLDEVP